MIKNEQYCKYLRQVIACVSYGDYYSIKELSNSELEKMEAIKEKNQKNIKKIKIKRNVNLAKKLDLLNEKELRKLIEKYSDFIQKQICTCANLELLQKEHITIEEFMDEI